MFTTNDGVWKSATKVLRDLGATLLTFCILNLAKLYKDWISYKIDDIAGFEHLKKLYNDGKLTDAADPVIQFLFKPDHKTELTKEQCEAVYTLIKDFDNNKDYSLLGSTSPATFALFKKIFETSVRHGAPVYWN